MEKFREFNFLKYILQLNRKLIIKKDIKSIKSKLNYRSDLIFKTDYTPRCRSTFNFSSKDKFHFIVYKIH